MWASFDDIGLAIVAPPMFEQPDRTLRTALHAAGATLPSVDAVARQLDRAMDRYACGDESAFDELYRYGAPRVRSFLLRLCADASLADDLTQEAFFRVHRARGSFAPGAAALPWMLAIARNALRDHLRRARVRPTAGSTNSEEEVRRREAPADSRADETFAARELLDRVRSTLQALPVLQREAFVLLRFEGMSVSEAAQVLGVTEGAVKLRAFRAYEALRAALGAFPNEGPLRNEGGRHKP